MTDARSDNPRGTDAAGAESSGAGPLDSLQLILGETSPVESHVHLRTDGFVGDASWSLSGSIAGPECMYAHTLSTTVALRARLSGARQVGEGLIPDPCYWTPEMPYLYRARVELRQGARISSQREIAFGIRPLGVQGRSLVFAGQRWVLRGVFQSEAPGVDLAAWHDAGAAMRATDPDDELCEAASRIGVLIVADLSRAQNGIESRLLRLSRWPAVGFAILPANVAVTAEVRRAAANMLLAYEVDALRSSADRANADVLLVNADEPQRFADLVRDAKQPAVAVRPAGRQADVAAPRKLCDRLQRDLAQIGDFAGYVV